MKSKWICSVVLVGIASFVCLQASAVEATKPATSVSHSPEQTKQSGEAFMEANKTQPGVVTLPSGLQYKILEAGSGKKPSKSDTVTVNYKGTLIDGKVFDSGQHVSFPVGGVIVGWQEALQLMNTGAKWMLYIPPQLAYGSTGAGGLIGPNETLVFEVELLSIQ